MDVKTLFCVFIRAKFLTLLTFLKKIERFYYKKRQYECNSE